MDFRSALTEYGFGSGEERGRRGRIYTARPNHYLTYSVSAFDDGTALFTWEFAIADFLAAHGMAVGDNERLNLFMYPAQDDRGPQDGAWLAGALERAEESLRSLRFDTPDSDTTRTGH